MNPDSDTTTGSPCSRRDFIKAGLTGALTVGDSRPAGQAFSSEGAPQDESKRRIKHRIIDAHNHPRWIGHNGARMIENMDAAGIERTWLLSWEVPESELESYYFSVLNPTGVGIPFRDVIDVVERYPFWPGSMISRPTARSSVTSLRSPASLSPIPNCSAPRSILD